MRLVVFSDVCPNHKHADLEVAIKQYINIRLKTYISFFYDITHDFIFLRRIAKKTSFLLKKFQGGSRTYLEFQVGSKPQNFGLSMVKIRKLPGQGGRVPCRRP